MSRRSVVFLLPLAGLAAYLAAWPVPIEPVAWKPARAPALSGPFAPNDRLRAVERFGEGVALGPEATAIDAAGNVFTGTRDGRILRLDAAKKSFKEFAATGGRPLGMTFDFSGRLVVCDAVKGLMAVSVSGEVRSLATEDSGLPFRFTNDVDTGPDGTLYFTDASSRFGVGQYREDILEHGGNGRLLSYSPATGKTSLLLSGLQFANGVAVAGGGSYLVVNETGAYRLVRYWLSGPKGGTSEPFFENLPGLPDNITWSAARKAFWVALFSPRVPALDLLAGHPFLRKVALRLPLWAQPQPRHQAWALALDERGTVVESLQDASPGAFAPVTSVRERDGFLWLGSLEENALGRIAAPPLPVPPPVERVVLH
jgi:sugar lactone lactonase YvrE